MRAKIVQTVGGQMVVATVSMDAIEEAMSVRNAKKSGEVVRSRGRIARREELIGLPTFSGFCGPMWDGYGDDDEPVVRYEDWETYRLLSV